MSAPNSANSEHRHAAKSDICALDPRGGATTKLPTDLNGVQGVAGSNPAVPTSSSNAFDPDVVEDWKWVKPKSPGTPVWSHDGIICTGESYKHAVKLTFAKGASLKDPARLFNSSLDGNVRRAIDIHEGETVDASAFETLVRQAVALNGLGKR